MRNLEHVGHTSSSSCIAASCIQKESGQLAQSVLVQEGRAHLGKRTLETAQSVADSRGGECLSSTYTKMSDKMRWRCAEGHEWEASLHSVKNGGTWCPLCSRTAPSTLKVAHLAAHKRGGFCLSEVYKNAKAKLKWCCEKGHHWEASLDSVKNGGTWCPHCYGNAPLSLDVANQLAENRGGVCLSAEYKACEVKMAWRCAAGHEFSASLNKVKNAGSWCPHCAGNARLSIKVAEQVAKERGGVCLSKTYTSTKAKMWWQCAEGHEWAASLNSIKNLKTWCRKCARKPMAHLEVARDLAAKRGGTCLSTSCERTSARLRWRCASGHEWGASLSSVKQGSWCMTCYHSSRRLGLSCAQEVAAKKGGQCLSSEYVNAHKKMRWRCAVGHEWEASLTNIKDRGSWCSACSQSSSWPETCLRGIMEAIFPGRQFPRRRPPFLRGPLGRPLELDGYNEELQLAFEYNGEHHYMDAHFWNRHRQTHHTPTHMADIWKARLCSQAGSTFLPLTNEACHSLRGCIWPYRVKRHSHIQDATRVATNKQVVLLHPKVGSCICYVQYVYSCTQT